MSAIDSAVLLVRAALENWSKSVERIVAWRCFPVLVSSTLAVVAVVLYIPALGSGFQGDDFHWLHYIIFRNNALFDGVGWQTFLTPFFEPGSWIHFRPLFQLLFLLDYTAWGTNPFGYHLTSLVLHVATSVLVFVLYWELTRARLAAAIAGLLFAVMPVHVEAVTWFAARADVLCTVWFLVSVVFFVFYRQRGRVLYMMFSLLAFAMALTAKEIGTTLPALIVLYDLVYTDLRKEGWRTLIARNLPFGILLLGYLVLRIALFGQLGSYAQSHLFQPNWDTLVMTFIASLFNPFVSSITREGAAIVVILALVGILLLRTKQALYGMSWLVITVIPSFWTQDGVFSDRFTYLPSVGLALALASLLVGSGERPLRRYVVTMPILVFLLLSFGVSLRRQNMDFARSAEVTRTVPDQVRKLHPSFPAGARLVFTGIPSVAVPRGVQGFVWVLPQALHIAYNDQNLNALSYNKFPLWLDDLERTYFFEYRRGKVTERSDLVQALVRRKQCANVSQPRITWTFEDTQGWEPWNDLAPFQVHDGILTTRSDGQDPYMVSPTIDVPTMAVGEVEITMRVRSSQNTFKGQVYWQATDQEAFSPGLQESFEGTADGEFHTYRMDLSSRGMLLIGDSITRLRLDPMDAPGEIELKSIRVNAHCSTTQDGQCQCSEGDNR